MENVLLAENLKIFAENIESNKDLVAHFNINQTGWQKELFEQ